MKAATILKFFSFIITVLIVFSEMQIISGCANIIPPSGGPRDSLAPKLIKASPADSTVNFSGNRISFTFDEFIDVQDVQANLIVSPLPAKSPVVDYRLNTLSVKFTDAPDAHTTYFLNFGNAIRDYNEGNILKGFTYTFSTGPALDSLSIRGKVILAETGKTDSTLIVVLHKNGEDSAVSRNRPNYMTKLDGSGNFLFRNMPPGIYYIYALQDQGGSRRLMDPKQLFAFADAPVNLTPNTPPVTLFAYSEKQTVTPGITGIRPRAGSQDNRLKYQTSIINGLHDLLENFTFTFEMPLKNFDSSKIYFTSDSAYKEINNYSWEQDSAGKKIHLKYPWKENTLYHFILEKDFARDSAGKILLKRDTLTFRTRKQSEYGTLTIRFRNPDLSVNPVVQFLSGNELKKSIPLVSAMITEPLFLPGDYEMRILYDRNKNGKWDPGEFFGKHLQPEIVKPIERRITIRPNFNNEFEIAAPSNSPKAGG